MCEALESIAIIILIASAYWLGDYNGNERGRKRGFWQGYFRGRDKLIARDRRIDCSDVVNVSNDVSEGSEAERR